MNASQLMKILSALDNPESVQVAIWTMPGLQEAGEKAEAQTVEIRHALIEGTPVGSIVIA